MSWGRRTALVALIALPGVGGCDTSRSSPPGAAPQPRATPAIVGTAPTAERNGLQPYDARLHRSYELALGEALRAQNRDQMRRAGLESGYSELEARQNQARLRELLRRGLEAGYPEAYAQAGALMLEAGQAKAGTRAIFLAAQAGHPGAMFMTGSTLWSSGKQADGAKWIAGAARAGSSDARAFCADQALRC